MASLKQFKLPDVGEGLTEAEIVRWHVKPGDPVTQNQTIVEIETAKALVELPCPFAGVVSELLVAEGTTVDVGTPIITVDVAATVGAGDVAATVGAGDVAAAAGAGDVAPAEEAAPTLAATDATAATDESSAAEITETPEVNAGTGRTSVLVGYGPRGDTAARRRPRPAPLAPAAPSRPAHTWPSVAPTVAAPAHNGNGHDAAAEPEAESPAEVLAKPPVRKLARDLGIDLHSVHGSGRDGTITRADVEAAADQSRAGTLERPMPRGGEERIPIRGVRKATAQAMVASAFSVPHVTEFTTIDITPSMRAVERLRSLPEFADVKVSPLLLVAKAILLSIERYPMVNSVWDDRSEEIVVKHYVNLGIAAATPRGLVVPNIKNAEALSLPQLARAINALAATAREGRTSVADMQHGTFTITNVGVFGIDTGTPIINPGEAAILAFGAVREQPWVHRGEVKPRWVTTLAMSFDHRIIDGELGSRFLRDVAMFLEDPAASLLARL
jgi:2-oxoisovalerate dehydrogenase E2 component (dihydrolipoyl transacylase)